MRNVQFLKLKETPRSRQQKQRMLAKLKKRNEFAPLWNQLKREEIDKLAEAMNEDCDAILSQEDNGDYHRENVEYIRKLVDRYAYDNLEGGLGYSYGEIRNWYMLLYIDDFYLSGVQLKEGAKPAFPRSLEAFKKITKKE